MIFSFSLKQVCVGETLPGKGLSWPSQYATQVLDKGTK